MPAGRPWLSPGPPPWVRRPPWWQGLGRRVAAVCLLFVLTTYPTRKDPDRDL